MYKLLYKFQYSLAELSGETTNQYTNVMVLSKRMTLR